MILEAFNHDSPINYTEDATVPRSEIPTLLKGVHEISERLNVKAPSWGHAGDGNVHVNIQKGDLSDQEWEEKLALFEKDLYDLALSLGGSITGEHGIGSKRNKLLSWALGPEAVEMMRGIKDVFDPNHILNPGKVLPES